MKWLHIWVTLWIVKLLNAIFCEENLAIKMRIEAKKQDKHQPALRMLPEEENLQRSVSTDDIYVVINLVVVFLVDCW